MVLLEALRERGVCVKGDKVCTACLYCSLQVSLVIEDSRVFCSLSWYIYAILSGKGGYIS